MTTTDDDATDVIQPSFTAERLCSEANQRLAALALAPVDGRTNPQVTPRNLRYYQTLGLLPPVGRIAGRAVYGAEHLEAVIAIKRAQAGGTTLREIPRWMAPTPPDSQWRVPSLVHSMAVTAYDDLHIPELQWASMLYSPAQNRMNAVVPLAVDRDGERPLIRPTGDLEVHIGWTVDLGNGMHLTGTGDTPKQRVLHLIKNLLNESDT